MKERSVRYPLDLGNNSMTDDSKFFQHGRVQIENHDVLTRQSSIRVQIPCCLFQTISPHLLGSGTIDELRISNPIVVWFPQISIQRFTSKISNIDIMARQAMEKDVENICKTYKSISEHLVDPSDLIPMLPLGTYINFLFRCRVDSILSFIEGIQSIQVVGINEIQMAFASVLHQVLEDFEKVPKKIAWELIPYLNTVPVPEELRQLPLYANTKNDIDFFGSTSIQSVLAAARYGRMLSKACGFHVSCGVVEKITDDMELLFPARALVHRIFGSFQRKLPFLLHGLFDLHIVLNRI